MDDYLNARSIVAEELRQFQDGDCNVNCNNVPRCNRPHAAELRSMRVGDFKDVEIKDMVELVDKTGWEGSVNCPWFHVARQALVIEQIGNRFTKKAERISALKEFAALPGVNAHFSGNTCSAFSYKTQCLQFFRQYPVLLLMWGNDPTRTCIHYRKLLKLKPVMTEMICSEPLLETFFQGKCLTSSRLSNNWF